MGNEFNSPFPILPGDDLAALMGIFAALGYVPCVGDEIEARHEKVSKSCRS